MPIGLCEHLDDVAKSLDFDYAVARVRHKQMIVDGNGDLRHAAPPSEVGVNLSDLTRRIARSNNTVDPPVMLHTRWRAWSVVSVEFRRALALRSEIRRAG